MNIIERVFVLAIVGFTCVDKTQKMTFARVVKLPDVFNGNLKPPCQSDSPGESCQPTNLRRQEEEADKEEEEPCPDKNCDGYAPLIIKPVIIKLYRYPDIDNSKITTPSRAKSPKPSVF